MGELLNNPNQMPVNPGENTPTPQQRILAAFSDSEAYQSLLTRLTDIEISVIGGPIERLFVPTAENYIEDFDLKHVLGATDIHLTVWDIGCGRTGAHLDKLASMPFFNRDTFFGINPYLEPNNHSSRATVGVVEMLDSDIIRHEAEQRGAGTPDILLLRNILRHMDKRDSSDPILVSSGTTFLDLYSRAFHAMSNVLPEGGQILIFEDPGRGVSTSDRLKYFIRMYNDYVKMVNALGLPFKARIVSVGTSKQYLELTKIPPSVPENLTDVYRVVNLNTPMAPAVTDTMLAADIYTMITEGRLRIDDYATCTFDDSQIANIGKATTAAHLKRGIPVIIDGNMTLFDQLDIDTKTKLQSTAREMVSRGITGNYSIDPEKGVFVASTERFRVGWHGIREKVYLVALNYIDGMNLNIQPARLDGLNNKGENTAYSAQNTQRLKVFLTDQRYSKEVQQFVSLLRAASIGVNLSSKQVQELAKRLREEYDYNVNQPTAFHENEHLSGLIDGVDLTVWGHCQTLAEEDRVPEYVVERLINDITRRLDPPKD